MSYRTNFAPPCQAVRADQFYKKWRAGQAIPGSPPFKKSQPLSTGPMRPVEVRSFCFDEVRALPPTLHLRPLPLLRPFALP